MNFCSHCGSSQIIRDIPEGDNIERYICRNCGNIFYENPKIVTACIAEWNDRILLCRRAIEPRIGTWTIPGGFMENGESIKDAALREVQEESCATINDIKLFALYNLKYINQVYVVYYGQIADGKCSAGHETEEVLLCRKDEIPWNDISFTVIKEALQRYLSSADRDSVYQGDIIKTATSK